MLIGGLLLVVVAIAVGVYFLSRSGEKGINLTVLSDKVAMQVREFHYTEVGDSETLWEIRADSAQYIKSDEQVLLKSIQARFVAADGQTYMLKGNDGLLYRDTRDIEVSGNVVVTSSVGDRLKTESLKYTASDMAIHANGSVTMENPNIRLTGTGMKFSMKKRHMILFSDVKAIIDNVSFKR